MHFLSFNLMDKHTTITYIDSNGNWIRANKGVLEQILNLCKEKEEIVGKVHAIIDKFAERVYDLLGLHIKRFQNKLKKVLEVLGHFVGCCPSLILQGMTVLRPSVGHLTLEFVLR